MKTVRETIASSRHNWKDAESTGTIFRKYPPPWPKLPYLNRKLPTAPPDPYLVMPEGSGRKSET